MAASTSTSVGTGVQLDPAVILQGLVNMAGDKDNAETIRRTLATIHSVYSPSQAPTTNCKKRTLETDNVADNKKKKEHTISCHICDRTFSTTDNLNRHVNTSNIHADKLKQSSETASKKTPTRGKGNRRAGKETKCGAAKETKLKNKRHGTEGGKGWVCASSDRYDRIVYRCLDCKTVTSYIDGAVTHARRHKRPNFKPITKSCDICGWLFERCYFNYHSTIHGYGTIQGYSVYNYNPDRILDKKWRDRFLVSLETYAKHIKSSSIYQHTRKVKMDSNSSSGRPLYKCSRCLVCVRPEEVEDHCDLDGTCEETPHPPNFCTQCNEIFCTSDVMEEHKKEHERYGADCFRTIIFNRKENAPIDRELRKLRKINQDLDISTCTHVLLKNPLCKIDKYAGPYRVLKRTKDSVTVNLKGVYRDSPDECTLPTTDDSLVKPVSPTYKNTTCDGSHFFRGLSGRAHSYIHSMYTLYHMSYFDGRPIHFDDLTPNIRAASDI